jgi:hypothetical protein
MALCLNICFTAVPFRPASPARSVSLPNRRKIADDQLIDFFASLEIVLVVSMSLISNAEKISHRQRIWIERRRLPRAPAKIAARRSKSPLSNAPAP